MTTEQVMHRTKWVTRRFGWWFLRPGDELCAVKKAMGLKKGEKVVRLAAIRVVSTRPEPLNAITKAECIAEGFPHFEPADFIRMLTAHYRCAEDATVNRIEFEYIRP